MRGVGDAAFSPDGRRLLLLKGPRSAAAVTVAGADGRSQQALTRPGPYLSLDFSPNGQRIVFTRVDSARRSARDYFERPALAALRTGAKTAILNLMVQSPQIDRTFAALADPTRRAALERLGRGNASITELAEPFGISLTGMKKHVRVLEDAELVTTEKVGRARRCRPGPRRLEDVRDWMETYQRMLEERLDRFGELLERTKGAQR